MSSSGRKISILLAIAALLAAGTLWASQRSATAASLDDLIGTVHDTIEPESESESSLLDVVTEAPVAQPIVESVAPVVEVVTEPVVHTVIDPVAAPVESAPGDAVVEQVVAPVVELVDPVIE